MCCTRRDRVTRGQSHRPIVAWAKTDRASQKTDHRGHKAPAWASLPTLGPDLPTTRVRETDLTDQAKHMRLNLKGSVRVLNPPPTSPQVTFSKPWGQPACAGGREIQKQRR